MQCPACGSELSKITSDPIVVDACQNGCGGIWFDDFELQKVDETSEPVDPSLLTLAKSPALNVDQNKRYTCPKCQDVVMMRHFYSVKRKVLVDECPQCGGIWLDAGELAQIRELFGSEEAAHKAAKEYFSEQFDTQINKVLAKDNDKLKSARKVHKLFKRLGIYVYPPDAFGDKDA